MSTVSPAVMQDADSDVTLPRYRIAVEIYVVGTLCALGIAGNLLSIIVLGRDHTTRRTTGFMLQMLAVADVVYLISCLFYQTINCAVKWTDWLPPAVHHGWPFVEVYAWPTASVAQTATVWLVVVLTVDRYIAICHPLHAAEYSTMSRVRRAVATVWILAAAYNLPRFFERVVDADVAVNSTSSTVTLSPGDDTITSRDGRGRGVMVQRTAMRDNAVYVLVYKTCLFFVVRFLIPFAALAFFNQRLIRAVRASDQIREQSARYSGGHSKELQKMRTLLVVVVVVVFVVCELPDLILRAWMALNRYAPDRVPFPRRRLLYVNIASNLLLTVNSSINFVIYCFMGRRFRLILLQMIGCQMSSGSTPITRGSRRARTMETVGMNRRLFRRKRTV